MTDRDELIEKILNEPADDLPRLVFADWLMEQGECDRAEFIRVQVALAGMKQPQCPTAENCYYANECAGLCGVEKHFALQARERELMDDFDWWPKLPKTTRRFMSSTEGTGIVYMNGDGPFVRMELTRGFGNSLTFVTDAIGSRRTHLPHTLNHLPAILNTQPIEKLSVEGQEFVIDKIEPLESPPHWWTMQVFHPQTQKTWPTRSDLVNGIAEWIESVM